jgi:Flp pilus assembly CpaE family ATPase
VGSGISPNLDAKYTDSIGAETLSIALIGPDEERRKAVAAAVAEYRGAKIREFYSYPTSLDEVPRLLEQYFDVIIIDLDTDPEFALELVESISAKDAATVMVYSAIADQSLVVRCMRAGAREYLISPFDQGTVDEALIRAAAISRPRTRPVKKSIGRLLVFLGAKGGSGVTTIACNFAIALAQESGQSTLLIDLALPMGDAALNLGIAAEYSTDHALQDADRLDASFLLKLVAKHQSGVSLLAAPSKVPEVDASREAIDKLMSVARGEFDNVIVDAGSRIDLMDSALFREATTIFLVTQAGISELRNSNRLISRFFNEGGPKLEVVINRFEASFLGVTEDLITKALSRPVRWKIPDDYDATRQMQNSSTSLALADSRISRLILEMASSVTGQPVSAQEKKKGFSLKGLSKSITEKISTDKPMTSIAPSPAVASASPAGSGEAPVVEWPTPEPISYGTALGPAQLNAQASAAGTFAYTPGPGYVLPAGTHTIWVTFNPEEGAGDAPVQAAASITVSKATPSLAWSTPAAVSCGVALSATQLNATASIPGTFVYSPAAGDVLDSGKHTLSVTFTPKDQANYTPAEAEVSVTVAKMAPAITWPAPEAITCGVPLSSDQLNASSTVPGTFVYSPAEGETLAAGMHTLSVAFTPTNETSYTPAQATVPLSVSKAIPVISWPEHDSISYGTALSSDHLNATASVPGTFVYSPGIGSLLAVGEHTPSVLFTPTDGADYTTAEAAIMLSVTRATPAITWPTPSPISATQKLGETQLNATASVQGKFVYSPAAGATLNPGAQMLSVTFTPADTLNYTAVQATVSITVTEVSSAKITWHAPAAISYGVALNDVQLNATASVPGTFVYFPGEGNVLAPGKYPLTAIFTPADIEKYAPAKATVALEVKEVPDIHSLITATTQTPATKTANGNSTASANAKREGGNAPARKIQRETRTYKGAIYEKGDDGQWHLQQK